MRYRVQYCIADERRTAEIEAASPHEAVVKFRHTRPEHQTPQEKPAEILSVWPEPACDEMAW